MVLMVQTVQDRTHHDAPVLRKLVSMCLQQSKQIGTPFVEVWHPPVQETSQVRLGERDHNIQLFRSQRADNCSLTALP